MTAPAHIPFSQDAGIVLALAETAIPFAASHEDEAERWVRVLRMHGQVGGALQALGVGEAPLATIADEPWDGHRTQPRRTAVSEVGATAQRYASGRDAKCVSTVDVLFAVFEIYGGAFDRALYVRGAMRDELLERLAAEPAYKHA